jgi:predicted AlkP superfamily pyrophosphatase or phosphodiesterase
VQAEKLWEKARSARPDLKAAVHFWWYNMYSSAELSVTLRPIYPADGRKIPALYSHPDALHRQLEERFGDFPMFDFWGPNSGIRSSRWIAESAAELFAMHRPDLLLVYLPHLDYSLQKVGPAHASIRDEVRAIDQVAGKLIDSVRAAGAEVAVVSEYGIEEATGVVPINQILRDAGKLAVRETLGWELLDAGASDAFAVVDHQVAHIYVRDPAQVSAIAQLLRAQQGIAEVLDAEGKRREGLDHQRSGELIAVAEPGHWFSYYYWLDDARAPDFARTVDIHRKPGYDPVELFLDPDRPFVKGRLLYNLARKKLGFRYLMDVIPLRPDLVRGTHGRRTTDSGLGPLLISSSKQGAKDHFAMTDLCDFFLTQLVR